MVARALVTALLLQTLVIGFSSTPSWADFRAKNAAVNKEENEVTGTFFDPNMDVFQVSATGTPRYIAVTPGKEITLRATGVYHYATAASLDYAADAECSDVPAGAENDGWSRTRGDVTRELYDVKMADTGRVIQLDWEAVTPGNSLPQLTCDPDHEYTVKVRPISSSISFFIDDGAYTDNSGAITIHIEDDNDDGPPLRMAGGTAPYDCDKHVDESPPTSTVETVGAIEKGLLHIDARDDRSSSAPPPTGSEYYESTGHWGVYTCNWPDPHYDYRVTVTGVYQYDMNATSTSTVGLTDYGYADAECTTGYPRNPVLWPGDPEEKYAPWHVTDWHPTETATVIEDTPTWKPHRYGEGAHDFGDLYVNFKQVKWQPVHDVAPNDGCADGGLSDPDHEYYATFTAGSLGEKFPIYFQIQEPRPYYELDNCGYLQIRIQKVGTTSTTPFPTETTPPRTCDPEPRRYFHTVSMREAQQSPQKTASNLAQNTIVGNPTATPGYYYPPRALSKVNVPDNLFLFKNQASGRHTISVDGVTATMINGSGNLEAKTIYDPTVTVPGTTVTYTSGAKEVTFKVSDFYFDSSPGCSQENVADPTSDCMNSGAIYPWTPSSTIDWTVTRSITISYYCKTNNGNVHNFGMRGLLVLVQ